MNYAHGDDQRFDNIFKIVVMGEPAVGKSALTLRYITENFVKDYNPTIEDSFQKQVTLEGKSDLIEVIDTAGSNDFDAMFENWVSDGNAFILVYAINDRASFEKITAKRERVLRVKEEPNVTMMLIGNKCDLDNERVVDIGEGAKLAKRWNCNFMETSAKEKINIEECFTEIHKTLRKLIQPKKQAAIQQKRGFWKKLCKIL